MVQQELKHLYEVKSEKQQVETSVNSAKQQLAYFKLQYDEWDEEIQSKLTDKKKMVDILNTQLESKEQVLDILDEKLKQKSAFLELLELVKQMIQSYLPLQPDIEEFENTVERGENITRGNSFRCFLSTLGQLLLSFKKLVQEGLCWFPRLMRWNTGKGELQYFGMIQMDIHTSLRHFATYAFGLTNLEFVLCCGKNTDKNGNVINDCYVPYSFRIEEINNEKFGEIYEVEYIFSKPTSQNKYSKITYGGKANLKLLNEEIKSKLETALLS